MNKVVRGVCSVLLCQCLMLLVFSPSLSAYTIESPLPKWGSSAKGTSGGTVKWSLMPVGTKVNEWGTTFTSTAVTGLTTKQVEQQMSRAFNSWSSAANINFKEVTSPVGASSLQHGVISVGAHSFGAANRNQLGYALYEIGGPNPNYVAVDIQFNSDWQWEVGNALGSKAMDLFTVALHEIGHALGLDHSAASSSVMRASVGSNTVYAGIFPDDIAGIQYLYGALTLAPGGVVNQYGTAKDIHVPEPSNYLLIGTFLLFASRLRRESKKVSQIS